MKKNNIKKITKKRVLELNEEIVKPAMEKTNVLDNKMLQLIRFKYQNRLKNVDSIKDVAKLFLQLSTSILVASISFPQLKTNTISTLLIVLISILIMATILFIRTKTSDEYYSEYHSYIEKQIFRDIRYINKLIMIVSKEIKG